MTRSWRAGDTSDNCSTLRILSAHLCDGGAYTLTGENCIMDIIILRPFNIWDARHSCIARPMWLHVTAEEQLTTGAGKNDYTL